MQESQPDYIAVINLGLGAGVYARGNEPPEAIESALDQAQSEFGATRAISGESLQVRIFEVTGRARLIVDEQGVEDIDTGERLRCLDIVERALPASGSAEEA